MIQDIKDDILTKVSSLEESYEHSKTDENGTFIEGLLYGAAIFKAIVEQSFERIGSSQNG